jgi:hypothetical protein
MNIDQLNDILGDKLKDQARDKIFQELFGVPRWMVTIPLLVVWMALGYFILSLLFE